MSEVPSDADPVDEVDEHRMPLIDHLRELRNRLVISVGALFAGVILASIFANQIIAFVRAPVETALLEHGGEITLLGPFEGMYAWLYAALLGGAILSSPVILGQIWGFVAPGLYKTERRIVMPLTAASTVLFVAGAGFAYRAIFPLAFPFMFSVVQDVEPMISLQLYLNAVVKMMLAFGVTFQLPVASFFLARIGLIDAKDMLFYFRYAVVGVFVLAALITPPDPLTQTLLAIPLVALYGVGIVVAAAFSTKERDDDGGISWTTHIDSISALFAAYGLISGVLVVAIAVLMLGAEAQSIDAPWARLDQLQDLGGWAIVGGAITGAAALTSIPALVLGPALRRRKGWARSAALVVAAIALLNFPFGTLVGLYAGVVLFDADVRRAFGGEAR
ncbi:MAG: twin-arginine translocase subunit TatC [Myxococcota bacterium]